MSERDAMLAAILADPDDDGPRLVFADWLDERGKGAGCLREPGQWRLENTPIMLDMLCLVWEPDDLLHWKPRNLGPVPAQMDCQEVGVLGLCGRVARRRLPGRWVCAFHYWGDTSKSLFKFYPLSDEPS